MKRRLTILFCILLLSATARAGDVRKITYEEAIRIALGESYTVKNFKLDLDASRYAYLYTRAQFKPQLDIDLSLPSLEEGITTVNLADGSQVYNSTSTLRTRGNMAFTYVLPTGGSLALGNSMYWQDYRAAPSESTERTLKNKQFYNRLSLSFNQPIFTANELREQMKVAEMGYQKTSYSFTRAQMDIVYTVTAEFYSVYEQAYEHQINLQRLENARETYRITKLKQETGNIPEGDLLIAEIAVAQEEARIVESEGSLSTAKDAFKQLIGLDLNEEIELQAEMEFESFHIDLSLAIDEALRNRLEIREDSIDLKLQQIELKRARRKRQVKANISAYYDFTGLSTRNDGSVGQLFHSSWQNMMDRPANRGVALTLSYPIADWGRAKQQIRREEVRLEQRMLSMDQRRLEIEREIRQIVRGVHEAEQRFRISQRNLEATRRSYRISQMRFANGDMTSQELSIEQERLASVQLSYIGSYISYRLLVANLNRKTMFDFEHNRTFLPEHIE